nr:MAG TPA: hypothetical protein [Caudoviricetes sp.]
MICTKDEIGNRFYELHHGRGLTRNRRSSNFFIFINCAKQHATFS